jgi:hypothetical protein
MIHYSEPFGEEDEHFDMNYFVDRNVHIAFQIVDELSSQLPSVDEVS